MQSSKLKYNKYDCSILTPLTHTNVEYFEKDPREIRKYCTQAGNVINILSREHQHNVNSLAFLSLFGFMLIERGELGMIAGTESIVNNLSYSPLQF